MSSDRSTVIHISRLGWFVVGVAALLPWVLLLWLVQQPAVTPLPPPSRPLQPAPMIAGERRENGPHGELVSQRILLEPPEEFIRPDSGNPAPLRWTFNHVTRESLDALWQRAGLPAPDRQVLNGAVVQPAAGTFVIEPPPSLVLNLSPESRAMIYLALAEFPENPAQHEPFRFRAENIDEWLGDTRISPEIIKLTRRLLYYRQSAALFSDQDIVLPRIPAMSDRLGYLKVLARRSALLVQLRVPHGADVDALSRYWRHGRRGKDVKPLLESLARQPGGGYVDIVHLLPPFARSLVNTYPDPAASNVSHDCHWTSFNFFEDAIDERYSDIEFVKQTLLSGYHPVSSEPALGDILLFVQPDGVVVHSCVHIANGIVFTKNGPSAFVPWTLSYLDNVIAAYSVGASPVDIRRYRLKL